MCTFTDIWLYYIFIFSLSKSYQFRNMITYHQYYHKFNIFKLFYHILLQNSVRNWNWSHAWTDYIFIHVASFQVVESCAKAFIVRKSLILTLSHNSDWIAQKHPLYVIQLKIYAIFLQNILGFETIFNKILNFYRN